MAAKPTIFLYFLFLLFLILILYYTLPVVADTLIYFYSLEDTNYFCYSPSALRQILFVNSNPADIYNFVIKNKSWPFFQRFKKHTSLDNYKKCSSLEEKNFLKFRKKWKGKSGIYKLTFLPCRLFTYFGSLRTKDLGGTV